MLSILEKLQFIALFCSFLDPITFVFPGQMFYLSSITSTQLFDSRNLVIGSKNESGIPQTDSRWNQTISKILQWRSYHTRSQHPSQNVILG